MIPYRIFAILVTGILFFDCTAYAHQPQDGEIRALGGVYATRNVVRDHAFSPPTLGGMGVVVEGDIDHHGGIEISAFYLRQFYSIQQDGLIFETVGKRMSVTTGYRHWFTPRYSVGAGLSASYAMGDPRVIHNEFPSGAVPKTSAEDTTDYGIELSGQIAWFASESWECVTDLRYSRTLTAKPGEAADFYGIVVGFKYLLQRSQAGSSHVAWRR